MQRGLIASNEQLFFQFHGFLSIYPGHFWVITSLNWDDFPYFGRKNVNILIFIK